MPIALAQMDLFNKITKVVPEAAAWALYDGHIKGLQRMS